MSFSFCEECRKMVEYKIERKEITEYLKGSFYTYNGEIATCNECGAEVYVPEVLDGNMEKLYSEYREKNGILDKEEIKLIPQKYQISKKKLSLMLGWGEATFTRYYDGKTPSKRYSKTLEKILKNPDEYLKILEENKEKLKSSEYLKSKEAVMSLIKAENEKKILLFSKYIIKKCGDVTPLSLQKMLYYVQGFYYAFFNSFLFEEDCEAWIHGPVYKDVYDRFKDYRYNQIESEENLDELLFTSLEISILDSVIKNFGCYSGKILEEFTHTEKPWLVARGNIPQNKKSQNIISKESIGEYFISVKDRYSMINPGDIKYYSKEMFSTYN